MTRFLFWGLHRELLAAIHVAHDTGDPGGLTATSWRLALYALSNSPPPDYLSTHTAKARNLIQRRLEEMLETEDQQERVDITLKLAGEIGAWLGN